MAAGCARRRALALACALCACTSVVRAEQSERRPKTPAFGGAAPRPPRLGRRAAPHRPPRLAAPAAAAIVSVECYLARDQTLANLRVKRAVAASFEWLCPLTAGQAARAGAPDAELCLRDSNKSAVGVVAKNLKGGVVGELAFQLPDGTAAKCGSVLFGSAPKGAPLEASAAPGRQLSSLGAACRSGGGLGRVTGAELRAPRAAARVAGAPGAAALAVLAAPCVDSPSREFDCKAATWEHQDADRCPTPGDVCQGLLSREGADYPHRMTNLGNCAPPPEPACVAGACIPRWGKPCCGRFRCTGEAFDVFYPPVGRCIPDESCLAAGAECGSGDAEAGKPCCRTLECSAPAGAAPGVRGVCAERACAAAGAACGTSNDVQCCGTGACVVPTDAPTGAPGTCIADVPGCAAVGAACSSGAFEGGCCNGAVCHSGGEGRPGVCVVG
jgi:hypothetical protein